MPICKIFRVYPRSPRGRAFVEVRVYRTIRMMRKMMDQVEGKDAWIEGVDALTTTDGKYHANGRFARIWLNFESDDIAICTIHESVHAGLRYCEGRHKHKQLQGSYISAMYADEETEECLAYAVDEMARQILQKLGLRRG